MTEFKKAADVSSATIPAYPAPPDEALLRRVQQENQREILGKLLHDLRNPVHSIRISMELFGRLARRSGDVDKLTERAAAYIGPAEAALENLLINSERLGRYLAGPAIAAIIPVAVNDMLAEVALLLRASRRNLQVTHAQFQNEPGLTIAADRARLGHVLLHCCLNNESAAVTLAVREEPDDRVCIRAVFAPSAPAAPQPALCLSPLSAQELKILVQAAGGTVDAAGQAELSLSFDRSRQSQARR